MLKFRVLIVSTLIAMLFLSGPARAGDGDDFADSALGKELINVGLKFLDDPGDFFFNLHSDNEDFSPLPSGKRGSIRFNFFPTFFPFTWGNLNLKANVLKDSGYQPQVDLVGMYGDFLALRLMQSGDAKPAFTDYSIGVTASKQANEKTKVFGGVKYSSVNMEVRFSTPVVMGAFEMDSIDFEVSDTFFFTGISHEAAPERIFVAQLGYGFKYKKIISRLMLNYRHLELGMDLYPEGLSVIHPFLAWHWFF